MPTHGRVSCVSFCCLCTLVIHSWMAVGHCTGGGGPWPDSMLADSDLHDVHFVDDQRGWAVGDRGVIWHTTDSGKNWHRHRATADGHLHSVHFADALNGWAVGGRTQPHTHRSVGIALRTQDGGQTWNALTAPSLPMLRKVRFYDRQRGRAIGRGSALYPTGVFHTRDGGRSWSTIPGLSSPEWSAGCLRGPHDPVLCSPAGELAQITGNRLKLHRLRLSDPRPVGDIAIGPDGVGYMVGDGGLVLKTSDGGQTWRFPSQGRWIEAAGQFDYRAVAVRDEHAWIAGIPGTKVFHTADGGKTWDEHATGSRLPIRAMTFVDPLRGWAVGALGTILATRDGGKSWQRQAGAGTRLAVLGIFDRPDSVPWPLIAHIAGMRYRVRVLVLGRPEYAEQTFGQNSVSSRLHEASLAAAATGADMSWRFPVYDASLRLAAPIHAGVWDDTRSPSGDPRDALLLVEDEIVRAIRMWRPDVVLTVAGDSDDADGFASLVHHSVRQGVTSAAGTETTDRRGALSGLPPWSARRIFTEVAPQSPRARMVSSTQSIIALGRTVGELADDARRLLLDAQPASPTLVGYLSLIHI